jgi:hypothetical protein
MCMVQSHTCAWLGASIRSTWGAGAGGAGKEAPVEVEGLQPRAQILLLVVLAKCDNTERPRLKERRPQGSPWLPSRPLLPPQPPLLHASVASIAGRNQPQHELPDQCGKQEHQPQ